MILAVFSDVHGNSIALNQCLCEINKHLVDRIVCLGDYVGYFPDYNEVLDLVQLRVDTCLLGNHDAMLLDILPIDEKKDSVYRITENKKLLSNGNLDFLKTLLPFYSYEYQEKKIIFVHGSPFNPLTEYMGESFDFRKFDSFDFDFLFCGHTHIPYIKKIGKKHIINVGSCSMPRSDGRFGSFAIFDLAKSEVKLRQIILDAEAITARYKNKVHPSVLKLLNRR